MMAKSALIVLATAVATVEGGDCYCSCCGWCHMAECFDGKSCCDDNTCSGCGTLEADLALNATRALEAAAKLEEVAVEPAKEVMAEVAIEEEVEVTGDCYCACCDWRHCPDCSGGCCGGDGCDRCSSLEDTFNLNATIAAKLEEVAVEPVEKEVAIEEEVDVTGDCYCACCDWRHCPDCSGGCCGGDGCDRCSSSEETLLMNATIAAKLEEVAVEPVKEEVAIEEEVEVTGQCYCACCNWASCPDCTNGCCHGDGCDRCGTVEETLLMNATKAGVLV